MENLKYCIICDIEKEQNKFPKRKGKKCKECINAYLRKYRTDLKNNLIQKKNTYETKDNITKTCTKCNKTLSINDFFLDKKNKDGHLCRCKICVREYAKNIDKKRRQKNKTKVEFVLLQRLRSRLRYALKAKNNLKSKHTIELLGCDIDTFKNHLQSLFDDDMSFELMNFEIDHYVPCAFFDLSIFENQQICFHYKNLQPLYKKDNCSKRDKLPEDYIEKINEIKSILGLPSDLLKQFVAENKNFRYGKNAPDDLEKSNETENPQPSLYLRYDKDMRKVQRLNVNGSEKSNQFQ